MKIVHVDDFAHPDAGYEINLLSRLQVRQGHDVWIVTGELDKIPTALTNFFGRDNILARDERFTQETGVKIHRVPLHAYVSGRAVFDRRIFRLIDDIRPDVTFVHGLESLTGMEFIFRAAKLPYPIVLDSHSVEMASVNRLRSVFRTFYRRVVTPNILKRKIPVIRIVDSDFVQTHLGIPLEYTSLLSFGTDTDHFRPDAAARAKFRGQHQIDPDATVVVYAGKLDAHKGARLLADTVSEPFQTEKPIVFVIVGNTDGAYGKDIEDQFKRSKNRIIRMPTQRYFDLATIYQAGDFAVYPRQCSVSFFEAQACGLPVIFEANEINDQRAKHGNAVTFIPGDVSDFRHKIEGAARMSPVQYTEMSTKARRYIVDKYNYVPIAQRFSDVLSDAVTAWRR